MSCSCSSGRAGEKGLRFVPSLAAALLMVTSASRRARGRVRTENRFEHPERTYNDPGYFSVLSWLRLNPVFS